MLSEAEYEVLLGVIADMGLLMTEVEDGYCESVCEIILDTLRDLVGDKPFSESVQDFYLRQRYKLPYGAETDKIDIRDYWSGGRT